MPDMTEDLTQEQRMALKGYCSARHAASLAGKSIGTIYNWLNAGHIEGTTVGRDRYVKYDSFLEHMGPQGCKLLNIPAKLEV